MNGLLPPVAAHLLYLLSAVLFIFGLKGMTKVRTARRGSTTAALGMLIAVVTTLLDLGLVDYRWIISGLIVGGTIGAVAAVRVPLTSMPEMVALFNGCGGGASALVAGSVLWMNVLEPGLPGRVSDLIGPAGAVTTLLSILIGTVTLSGSVIAFSKLKGLLRGEPILLPGRHALNLVLFLGCLGMGGLFAFWSSTADLTSTLVIGTFAAALLLGVLLVIPIGGADMPVVISLLNSYSGMAAAATGFVLENNVLIIAGSLVGAAGLILTKIMCVAMNRTLTNVLFGGFGMQPTARDDSEYTNVRAFSPEDAAVVFENAETAVIVPGYGLAVAQAQHAAKELGDLLEGRGVRVTYAIHPVAGRMPGHMNVLLAEADVSYDLLLEMDQANPEFKRTDVVLILGANDVVNPAANDQPGSPIYGMPILEVYNAQTVMVVKRSLSPGFAGIKNELFDRENTMMIFGDAKQVLQELISELKQAAA